MKAIKFTVLAAALSVGLATSFVAQAAAPTVLGTIHGNWQDRGNPPDSFYNTYYAEYLHAFASTPGATPKDVALLALPQARKVMNSPFKLDDVVKANADKLKDLSYKGDGLIAVSASNAVYIKLTDTDKGEYTVEIQKQGDFRSVQMAYGNWEMENDLNLHFPPIFKSSFKVVVGQSKAREIEALLDKQHNNRGLMSAIYYVKPTTAKVLNSNLAHGTLDANIESFDVAFPLKGTNVQPLFHVEQSQYSAK